MNPLVSVLVTLLAAGPTSGVWPLDPPPEVVHRFDVPSSPWGRGHRGVDLRGAPGRPVRAAEAGVVRFVGRIAGRGVVVVDHGGSRTTYEPVRGSLRVGVPVPAGGVIGRLELVGSHCVPAACLHWGLIEGRDTYLDPLSLVGGAVRLLPLSSPALPVAAPTGVTAGSRAARHAAGMPVVVTPRPARGSAALFRPGQARGWAWR